MSDTIKCQVKARRTPQLSADIIELLLNRYNTFYVVRIVAHMSTAPQYLQVIDDSGLVSYRPHFYPSPAPPRSCAQFTPSQVCKPLSAAKCIHVACGGQHTLALTEHDDVFGFGSDRHGQLGLGQGGYIFPVPSRFGARFGGVVFTEEGKREGANCRFSLPVSILTYSVCLGATAVSPFFCFLTR